MKDLTEKQKRFVLEYLKDLNATQAAIRAGYSEKTAHSIGAENLTKPEIMEYVEQMLTERSERTKIDADWVLVELHKQYRKADDAEDVKQALSGLDKIGKHVMVQAFNERKSVSFSLNDATDEELEARLAALEQRTED